MPQKHDLGRRKLLAREAGNGAPRDVITEAQCRRHAEYLVRHGLATSAILGPRSIRRGEQHQEGTE